MQEKRLTRYIFHRGIDKDIYCNFKGNYLVTVCIKFGKVLNNLLKIFYGSAVTSYVRRKYMYVVKLQLLPCYFA